jgi:hypothetical protein
MLASTRSLHIILIASLLFSSCTDRITNSKLILNGANDSNDCLSLTQSLEKTFRQDGSGFAEIAVLPIDTTYVVLSEPKQNLRVGGVLKGIHIFNQTIESIGDAGLDVHTYTRCAIEFDLGKKSALILYDGDIDKLVADLKVGHFYTFNILNHFDEQGGWKGPALSEEKSCYNDKTVLSYLDQQKKQSSSLCIAADDCILVENNLHGVTACEISDNNCIDKATIHQQGSGGHGADPGPLSSYYAECNEGRCVTYENCSICDSAEDMKYCQELQQVTNRPWKCGRISSCGCAGILK